MLYFSSVAKIVERLDSTEGDYRLSIAWYDTVGDYVQGFLLPISKYCFYSGNVSYESVHSVLDYYRTIKLILDTSGNRWTRSNLSIVNVEHSAATFGWSESSMRPNRIDCSSSSLTTSLQILTRLLRSIEAGSRAANRKDESRKKAPFSISVANRVVGES